MDKRIGMPLFVSNWRRILGKPRFYLVFIAALVYTWDISKGVSEYAMIADHPTSLWLFPLYMSNSDIVLIYFLLVILLFCDAPFLEQTEPFVLIRSGRIPWLLSQVSYIVSLSATYVIWIVFCSIITIFPQGALMNDWGALLYSLANTNAHDLVELGFYISPSLLSRFQPMTAMIQEMIICFFSTIFLGSVMFCINLVAHRVVGVVAGTLVVLEQFLASNSSGYAFFYFSPISWMNLERISFDAGGMTPSFAYVICFLIGVSLVCWIVSCFVFRRKPINVLRSM